MGQGGPGERSGVPLIPDHRAPPSASRKQRNQGKPDSSLIARIALLQAYLVCLPEADRWRMVPKRPVFTAPQMSLYSKFPDLRAESVQRLVAGCSELSAVG